MKRLALSAILGLVGACAAEEPPTALLLEFDSSLPAPDDIDRLQLVARALDGDEELRREFHLAEPFPHTFLLLPGGQLGEVRLEVTASKSQAGDPDRFVLRRVVETAFVDGSLLSVPIELPVSCVGVSCSSPHADCVLGRCDELDSEVCPPGQRTVSGSDACGHAGEDAPAGEPLCGAGAGGCAGQGNEPHDPSEEPCDSTCPGAATIPPAGGTVQQLPGPAQHAGSCGQGGHEAVFSLSLEQSANVVLSVQSPRERTVLYARACHCSGAELGCTMPVNAGQSSGVVVPSAELSLTRLSPGTYTVFVADDRPLDEPVSLHAVVLPMGGR